MNTSETKRFEGTCRCGTRITGNGQDRPWRHDSKPKDGHQATPTGTLTEI